jgi:inner membrane protein
LEMQSFEDRFGATMPKAGAIAILTVLMLWPLSRVETLVSERQVLQHEAYAVISAGFGGSQIVGSPIVSVDTQERSLVTDSAAKTSTEVWSAGSALHLLSDDVHIQTEVAVEVRSKGIYAIPVYVSKVVIDGKFTSESIARLLADSEDTRTLPAHAVFQLPISGVKYLRSLSRFDVGGQAFHATSGEVVGMSALSAPIDLASVDLARGIPFHLEFELAGSDSLRFLPLASNTEVNAHVAWPHPDFDGAFLPLSHQINNKEYAATWRVLELNRAFPQIWRSSSIDASILGSAFGVRLFQPSDVYTQNYRAIRYGILFVAITFTCFFAWEHLVRGLRLHPMQYLLVGLGLSTFYLLLLALSEHVGFGVSYAVAATALVALITTYIAGATNNPRAATVIGGALATSYAILYVILLSQDYALLFGSLLLFAILAALMLATRRLNWAKVGRAESEQ